MIWCQSAVPIIFLPLSDTNPPFCTKWPHDLFIPNSEIFSVNYLSLNTPSYYSFKRLISLFEDTLILPFCEFMYIHYLWYSFVIINNLIFLFYLWMSFSYSISFLRADTVSQMLPVSSGTQKVLNKYLEKKINVEANYKLILNPFNFRLILN